MKIKIFKNEFIKYFFSIFSSFLVDISILYFLNNYFFIHYIYASMISISSGFSINYFFNIKWVFNQRTYKNYPIKEYFYMILISILTSGINFLMLLIFTEIFMLYFMYSKISASFVTFFLKFYLRKNILFKD